MRKGCDEVVRERAIETVSRTRRVRVLEQQGIGSAVGPRQQRQTRPILKVRGGFHNVEVEHLPELVGDRAVQGEHFGNAPVEAQRRGPVWQDSDAAKVVR